MKKTLIQALFCLVTLMCGACTGQSKDDSGKDTPKEFIPTSWNGEFLKAISDAYETFSETDEMPVSVNVEGITYSQAKYFSAACGILDLIEAYPDTWQERPDVEIPKYSAGGVMQWNTFEQDEISLDAVKWMIGECGNMPPARGCTRTIAVSAQGHGKTTEAETPRWNSTTSLTKRNMSGILSFVRLWWS